MRLAYQVWGTGSQVIDMLYIRYWAGLGVLQKL